MDVGIYSVYRLCRHTFFELMSSWIEAAPGRTCEMRMFAQGLIFTDDPANIKAFMSSKVRTPNQESEISRTSDNHDSSIVLVRGT